MHRDDDTGSRTSRLAGSMSRRLVDELAAARQKRRVTPGGIAIYVLATAVHMVTLGFLAVGLWLLIGGDSWPMRVVGVVCLLVVAAVVPRVVRTDRGEDIRSSAPATTALVAEIAQLVGGPVPTAIHISDDLNATVSSGAFGGRTLTIGAPLWVVLSPGARVALIAHELGHLANCDLIHARYVAAAHDAVVAWHDIFSPRSLHDEMLREYGMPVPAGTVFAYALMWPVRTLLRSYLRLMQLANATASRRQELYADIAAVGSAGTDGTVDLLETTLDLERVVITANRVAVTTDRPLLRPALEELRADFGSDRRAQARRNGAAEELRVDDTHPPTVDRLRLVESVERSHPAVVLDGARLDAIEAELADPLDRALASFADLFRGW